nr:MAG TPA: hypothetical protein [Caudoviricetes sp.]
MATFTSVKFYLKLQLSELTEYVELVNKKSTQ